MTANSIKWLQSLEGLVAGVDGESKSGLRLHEDDKINRAVARWAISRSLKKRNMIALSNQMAEYAEEELDTAELKWTYSYVVAKLLRALKERKEGRRKIESLIKE